MSATITLVNPNLMTQRNDLSSSGIPYWPLTLAYAAAHLKKEFKVKVIDAFGEAPKQVSCWQDYYIH